jgi:hypothetical protein
MQKTNVNRALIIAFMATAVVVLMAGLAVIPVIVEEAQAKKGEAGQHISPEGRDNQSTEGAINSGVGGIACPKPPAPCP